MAASCCAATGWRYARNSGKPYTLCRYPAHASTVSRGTESSNPQGSSWNSAAAIKDKHSDRCRPALASSTPSTVLDAPANVSLRGLHAALGGPTQTGFVQTQSAHQVYYEVHGSPTAQLTALVLHGGPGAGCYANHARFFDPNIYRVVLMDQRGCGRSKPLGCLQDNNTQALIADIETLRNLLDVERWLLLGGSWGVTLALAYAQREPDRVAGIILRGVCTMRPSELSWMYGGGAGALTPWGWQAFLHHLPQQEWSCGSSVTAGESPRVQGTSCDTSSLRGPLHAYYRRLTCSDRCVRDAAAGAWISWEMAVGFSNTKQMAVWNGTTWDSTPHPRPANAAPFRAYTSHLAPSKGTEPSNAQARTNGTAASGPVLPEEDASMPWEQVLQAGLRYRGDPGMSTQTAQALLEAHYSVHSAFLEPGQLIRDVHAIRHIPCIAVHGQADYVCPPTTAFELHQAWPEMELRLVPGAGHSMYDPAITHELVEATDAFAQLLLPQPQDLAGVV